MITEVKERQVKTANPDGVSFRAVVFDGRVTELSKMQTYQLDVLEAYIEFLKEVIEAIKQTEP